VVVFPSLPAAEALDGGIFFCRFVALPLSQGKLA